MAARTTTTAFLLPATTVVAFLFLVLGFAAADPRPPNEAAGSFTLRRALTTSDVVCSGELADCQDDTSCKTCLDEYFDQEEECADEYASAAADGEVPCDDAQALVCCALAEEDENCENDTTFANYLECAMEELNPQCPDIDVDISDCNGASGLAFSRGALSVFNLTAAVAGLSIAVFGFVM